jgi:hypothetical protein
LGRRYQHHSELRADGVGLGKNAHDLVGCGIGRDVEIGRLVSEQQIAHAPANQVGFMASLPQGADNRDGKVFEHGKRNQL